jgi:uncharacterized protein (DUF58 family)
VKVKRCTRAIITAFLLLLSSALILDNPGLLFVSLALWILIIFRYFLFISRTKSVTTSVQIVRAVDNIHTRQGISRTVTACLTITGEDGVRAVYAEVIPAGLQVEDGEIQTHSLPKGSHELTLNYRITPLIHGDLKFSGGLLTVQDAFFETEIALYCSSFTGPVLHIHPYPLFEKSRSNSKYGEFESYKILPQKSSCVKTYRKYLHSDDSRTIDWKLTAKYDTLYVREYNSLEKYSPIIIVDLPDLEQEFDEKKFSDLIRAVSGNVEKTLRGGSSLSLLIISGPNIIFSLFGEHDLVRFTTIISERLHPHTRLHHLYRSRTKSDIRKDLKKLSHMGDELREDNVILHLSRLNTIYHQHLLDSGINKFSLQISRVFSSVKPDEISLFSLCTGDISYIREIAVQARYGRVRLKVRTPEEKNFMRLNPLCEMFWDGIGERIV